MLVVCGGRVSEPGYLNQMKNVYRNNLLNIKVLSHGRAPINVVQYAAELKMKASREAQGTGDPYLEFDEVWCVLDVDEHESLNRARDLARAQNIHLAVSNPCFELWLLLHFRSQNSSITTSDVQRACRGYMPGYEKEVPFSKIDPSYDHALRRATALEVHHTKQNHLGANPSTDIYKITEKIRKRAYEQ